MTEDIDLFCYFGKAEYFFKRGLTGMQVICPSGRELRQIGIRSGWFAADIAIHRFP
jgi:hypothetical protein